MRLGTLFTLGLLILRAESGTTPEEKGGEYRWANPADARRRHPGASSCYAPAMCALFLPSIRWHCPAYTGGTRSQLAAPQPHCHEEFVSAPCAPTRTPCTLWLCGVGRIKEGTGEGPGLLGCPPLKPGSVGLCSSQPPHLRVAPTMGTAQNPGGGAHAACASSRAQIPVPGLPCRGGHARGSGAQLG